MGALTASETRVITSCRARVAALPAAPEPHAAILRSAIHQRETLVAAPYATVRPAGTALPGDARPWP